MQQLKVSDTKVVLKHKAEVEGIVPVIKTKLSLEAIVGKYIVYVLMILTEKNGQIAATYFRRKRSFWRNHVFAFPSLAWNTRTL